MTVAALFAAYCLLMAAGILLCRPDSGNTVIWPANGVIVAAFLILPLRVSAPFALACLAVNLAANAFGGLSPALNLAYAPLNIFLAALTARLVRKHCGAATDLSRAARLAQFVAICLGAAALEATIGSAYAVLLNIESGYLALARSWLAWTFSDALGLVIATPAVLLALRGRWLAYAARAGTPERLALLTATLAATAAGFAQDTAPVHLAIYPLLVLAAFRSGPQWVAATVLGVALIATPLALADLGPIPTPPETLFMQEGALLHIFLWSVVFCALPATNALGERHRAARRLKRRDAVATAARIEAEHATLAKSRFLAVMSHEIRTPLNGIVGFSQALSTREDLPADARRQLDLVVRSSDILLGLVNDILDFSKIEAQRFDLSPAPTSMPGLIEEVAELLRPNAAAKGLRLRTSAEDFPAVLHRVDDRRLRQVLLNLGNNAVKFTASGAVTLALSTRPDEDGQGDRIRVSVTDTGIGVAPAARAGLFQPFSQLDPSITRTYGGTGLGLAISKSIIEIMGGAIGMDPGPGGGSIFWFEIPAPRCQAAAEPERSEPAAMAAAGLRVLVVDDHAVNREVATMILASAGCETETCASGPEAIEAALTNSYDVILMDVRMPGMDGFAATRAIRALPGAAGACPILALTADVMAEDIARAREAGMDGHVGKPIAAALLIEAVTRAAAVRAEPAAPRAVNAG